MLKFVPVAYKDLELPFCNDSSLSGYIGYDISNNNKQCGNCVFRLNGYRMEILFVQAVDNDKETLEGLIRSALNFGGNRNVYIAEFKADNAVDVAKMLGFKKENEIFTGDIPTLLKGSCCKQNQR